MTSLPGYSKLELADVLEGTAAQLVQLVIDAVKSGKKKVSLEIEVEAKLSDDGKSIEVEVEMEGKEGDKKEERKLEYVVPV